MKKLYTTRYVYWLLIFFFAASNDGYAQITQIPTPNAASFDIFNQYPQGSFTGVPSINIPVYDFNYSGLSLPIALRYNNNLVRPYSNEGWVGLGWNLTAGGTISRVINGKPDDRNWFQYPDYVSSRKTTMGYYYNYSALAGDWTSATKLEQSILDEAYMQRKNPDGSNNNSILVMPATISDYAPDEFSFSVGDLSGTFYLDHNAKWKVRSKNNVKIMDIVSSDFESQTISTNLFTGVLTFPAVTYLKKITLLDDRGIKYVFGGAPASLESAKNWANENLDWFVKAWNLTSITFPNGKVITFNYEQGATVGNTYPIKYNSSAKIYDYSPEYILTSYLKNIHTDLQDIDFSRSANPKLFAKLNSIKVTNIIDGRTVANFQFSYTNTLTDRLKLYSFMQVDQNNKSSAEYFFRYNLLQHAIEVENTDHWGFYTSTSFNKNDPYGSRQADTLDCRKDLLDRITYPGGGYSIYTWEPNTYSKQVKHKPTIALISSTPNSNTGGARIKQITNFDNNGTRIGSKRYVYNAGYSPATPNNPSSGILYDEPFYYTYQSYDFDLNSNVPLSDAITGSHVTYSETAEINDDGSYSTTLYSNFDTGVGGEYMDQSADGEQSSSPGLLAKRFTSNGHERGYPLKEKSYTNTGVQVSEKQYDYVRIDKENNYVRAIMGRVFETIPGGPGGTYSWIWDGAAVRFYTNAYLPQTIKEKLFDVQTGQELVTTTNYAYDVKTLNPTTITRINSKGQTVKTRHRYVNDILEGHPIPSNPSPVNFPYFYMLKNNMTGEPIETIQSIIKNGTEYITGATLTKYQGLSGTLETVVPVATYQAQFSGAKTSYLDYSLAMGLSGSGEFQAAIDPDLKVVTSYTKWDGTTAKLLEYKNKSESPISYKWGYKDALKIAECKNAAYNEFYYEGFEDITSLSTLVPYGGHTGRNCVTSYTTTWAPPSGTTRSYVITYWYRDNNVWKFMPEQPYNVNFSLVGGDAFDDICVYPAGAQMTTYTHIPAVGVSSVTDARGATTYYEYDRFNRLRIVKDGDKKILKAYCYNFKNQRSECLAPQPPTGVAVYAKLTLTNTWPTYTPVDDYHGYWEERGTVTVGFYKDEACTIPRILPVDMYLYVVNTYEVYDEFQGTTSSVPVTNTFIAYAGQSSFLVGTIGMSYLIEDRYYDPELGMWTYNGARQIYSLAPSPTDTYIVK